ncbi:uncharacterized protein LOC111943908, partial [Cyanistes caeruleus]|uniref:uncharacterized protein LOC111943908 n=1 Tax=Cyanistes caeruleus TaxID=156563 RepID=UPI000CD9FEAF
MRLCQSLTWLCHGVTCPCQGLVWLCHGLAWLCRGLVWLCHGLAWLCHGLVWLCHGLAWLSLWREIRARIVVLPSPPGAAVGCAKSLRCEMGTAALALLWAPAVDPRCGCAGAGAGAGPAVVPQWLGLVAVVVTPGLWQAPAPEGALSSGLSLVVCGTALPRGAQGARQGRCCWIRTGWCCQVGIRWCCRVRTTWCCRLGTELCYRVRTTWCCRVRTGRCCHGGNQTFLQGWSVVEVAELQGGAVCAHPGSAVLLGRTACPRRRRGSMEVSVPWQDTPVSGSDPAPRPGATDSGGAGAAGTWCCP